MAIELTELDPEGDVELIQHVLIAQSVHQEITYHGHSLLKLENLTASDPHGAKVPQQLYDICRGRYNFVLKKNDYFVETKDYFIVDKTTVMTYNLVKKTLLVCYEYQAVPFSLGFQLTTHQNPKYSTPLLVLFGLHDTNPKHADVDLRQLVS